MLSLSSVASAILGVVTGENKIEKQAAQTNFLNLLAGNTGTGFKGFSHEKALVDTLRHDNDDDALPVAAPQESRRDSRDRDPLLSSDNARKEHVVREAGEKKDPADLSRRDVAPKEKTQTHIRENKNDDVIVASSDRVEVRPADINGNDFSDKIRSKINELRDILAALTSTLNSGSPTEVTLQVASVTETTAAPLQTSGNGVAPLFADLSGRFNQLIAAVESQQKLPASVRESLTLTFTSFQSLFSAPQVSENGITLGVESRDAFLRFCADCQHGVRFAAASLTGVAEDNPALADTQKLLKEKGDWINDFRNLIVRGNNSDLQTASGNIVQFVPPKEATPQSSEVFKATDSIAGDTPLLRDNKTGAVPQAGTNTTATLGQATASAAAANTNQVAANNSFSANTNSGGQGGERPATAPLPGAGQTSATQATSSAMPSFAKTLKAAAEVKTPLAEQIVFQVKSMPKTGGSKIHIQLDPVELGRLTIKLDVDGDGKTSVTVTADNKSTLDMLQRDARGLERALADAGLKADSGNLNFNLRGGDQNQQEQKNASSGYSKIAQEPEEIIPPLSVLTQNYAVQVSDGLDIKI